MFSQFPCVYFMFIWENGVVKMFGERRPPSKTNLEVNLTNCQSHTRQISLVHYHFLEPATSVVTAELG